MTYIDVDPYGEEFTCEHGEPLSFQCQRCPDGLARERPEDRLRRALLRSDQLDDIPDPVELIADVVDRDCLAWMTGKPGSGKSFVAVDLAACVSTGRTWAGQHQVHTGPVLYVVAEGVTRFKTRVRAWELAAGEPAAVTFLPLAVKATNRADWQALTRIARAEKFVAVVLDTQARMAAGLGENDPKDMGTWVDRLDELRGETGATVLPIHHTGRTGDNPRGHSVIDGAARTILHVKRDGSTITVYSDAEHGGKQNDRPEGESLDFRLIPTAESAYVTLDSHLIDAGIGSSTVRAWLSAWWDSFESDPVSVSQLVRNEIVAEPTFHRHKFELLKGGALGREGKGQGTRYRLLKDPNE